jgi:hypothetical protein
MGAALTYARRYALFTLVGIAGEDDIDAPDLKAATAQHSGIVTPPANTNSRLNGSQRPSDHNRKRAASRPKKPILGHEASALLREQLLAELKEIASAEDATIWAHRILGAKNSLTAADAQKIEDEFQAKLATLESAADIKDVPLALQPSASLERQPVASVGPTIADGIDKSGLARPEPRRFRDKVHVKFVAKQPCLICGRRPSDPHHLRFAQHRALGRKVSDEFTVPLCRGHHREVHHCGDEPAWWRKAGIDPTVPARALWLDTHPLPRAPDNAGNEAATSAAAVGTDRINATDGRTSKRRPNYKTKPIIATGRQ